MLSICNAFEELLINDIEIIIINIGDQINGTNYNCLPDDPENQLFSINDFNDLNNDIENDIIDEICQAPTNAPTDSPTPFPTNDPTLEPTPEPTVKY